MRILIDIMSGDKAPLEQLLGAHAAALEMPQITFVFIGNEAIIRAVAAAKSLDLDLSNIEIVHTDVVVTMEDEPLSVVREKKESSMGVGLKMLAEGKVDMSQMITHVFPLADAEKAFELGAHPTDDVVKILIEMA